ncbi:acetyl xylan esterase [Cronobacter turicensis]|nr:acetyl xylan esterase [Cronobacter turicensis]EGT5742591.1 acetyl xylan esterase [Cronobacter turicensis]
MQVHEWPQGAPVLALAGDSVSLKCMHGFLREKGGIFGNCCKDYCAASSARRRV